MSMPRLHRLGSATDAPFPPPELAYIEPNGLLAMGGDLSPGRLLNAYRRGIFPWFAEGEPILWWCPDPRVVFETQTFRLSRRLLRSLRHSNWSIRADTAFESVIVACGSVPRRDQDGTWITPEMRAAYLELHRLGHAHSIEVFEGDEPELRLIGGVYGVAIGRMFFGESMFSHVSGASKIALGALALRLREWGWPLIDGQVENPHLLRLGAVHRPRASFLADVATLADQPGRIGCWTEAFGVLGPSDLG
jgi:leucyl/phenylalanyl-tRNA---protein transferase